MKRWDVLIGLLRDRPHETGAEIGVQAGKTTFRLLSALPALRRLYCVDAWLFYPDYELDRVQSDDEWPSQRMLDEDRRTFMGRRLEFRDRIVVLEMLSKWACTYVSDDSLDFVFIDANHLYEYVKEDIRLWLPKLKPGGLMAGHDYDYPVPAWGVKEAVDEAFGDAVTLADDYTWWITKAAGPGAAPGRALPRREGPLARREGT